MNRTMKRFALPLVGAAVVATSGFAFMASNSVDVSHTGEGTGTVSGFTVTNVAYESCDSPNGNNCYTSFFAYATDGSGYIPGNAEIKFDGTGWFTCTAQDNYKQGANTGRWFTCQTNRPDGINPVNQNTLTVSVHS